MEKTLTFDDYIVLLKSGIYRQRIKLEMLRYSDFSIQSEITGDLINDSSSSMTVTRKNGIRRTVQFNLMNLIINNVAKNVPCIKEGFYSPRTPFKLYLGLADEFENEYLIPQGIFLLEDPVLVSTFASSILTINGVDSFSLFDGTLGGEIGNTYNIPQGTNLNVAIKGVLNEQKYPYAPILDSSLMSEVLPYTITKTSGGKLGDILVELASLYSSSIYFNRKGQPIFSADIFDAIKPSAWDFSTEENSYQGTTNTYKYSNLYNSVVVTGANINNLNNVAYTATATNTNLMSSTSVGNLGYTRTKFVTDNLIDSNLKCSYRATGELKKAIAEECDVSIPCIPIYHLDEDEVITLTNVALGLNLERFVIIGYTLPFTNGQMTINAVSAIDLDVS